MLSPIRADKRNGMSTWISNIGRCLIALMGVLSLSGCLGAGFPGFGAGGDVQRDVIRSVSLYDGDVVVSAPDGYCIDRRFLRDRVSRGFVMLASCESLSGTRGQNVEPVIMTLTIVPGGAGAANPSSAEIANSMSGTSVITSIDDTDLSLVHFASGGDQALAEKDPKHWRGAMAINGHLVALSLYGPQGSPMAGTDGQLLLRALAKNTKASSPVRSLIVESAAEVAPSAASEPTKPLWGVLFPNSG